MLNTLAGLFFGLFSADWATRLVLPFLWGGVACAYHAVFSRMARELFLEEKRRNGVRRWRARLIYYMRAYRRAMVISLIFSMIGGMVAMLR